MSIPETAEPTPRVVPVVGGTWQGACITAVHVYGDPLYPEDWQAVFLGWHMREETYSVWTVDSDGEYTQDQAPTNLPDAMAAYTLLVIRKLYDFTDTGTTVPTLVFFHHRKES